MLMTSPYVMTSPDVNVWWRSLHSHDDVDIVIIIGKISRKYATFKQLFGITHNHYISFTLRSWGIRVSYRHQYLYNNDKLKIGVVYSN